jgi:hypothetical protein
MTVLSVVDIRKLQEIRIYIQGLVGIIEIFEMNLVEFRRVVGLSEGGLSNTNASL